MQQRCSVDQATARRRRRGTRTPGARHPLSWTLALAAVLLPLLALLVMTGPAAAATTATSPQPCTEAGLNAALTAGGAQTFSCAPDSTITISGPKGVNTNVTLDGGGNLTIDGGGKYRVFGVNSSSVTFGVANLTITGGAANGSGSSQGGGIYLGTGTVNVTNSTITGNSSVCGFCEGGGIYNYNGTVNITNSTIANNTASSGGGIYNWNIMNITNSTISGNRAPSGAGITNNDTLKVTNSTIADNAFNCGEGGGIYNLQSGVLTVTNTTIAGNYSTNSGCSSAGGGIANPYGTMTVTGSIVAGNSANSQIPGQGPDIDNFNGHATYGGGNLLNANAPDPKLAPLDYYGGTTQTRPPVSGSPAIDNGMATCTVADPISGTNLSTDQRGVRRPQGAKCDSGSVESVSTAITSATSATFTVGTMGRFTVVASGYPTPTLSETGYLPAGVTFVDNQDGTATLSGTPDPGTGNTYALTLTASNGGAPDVTQAFTLTVNEAPGIYTDLPPTGATFTVGTMRSFFISQAGGYPTATVSELGALPTGVTFAANMNGTATLSGTPAAGTGGTYTLTIKVSNGVAPDATENVTLTVNEAPAITTDPDDQTVNAGAAVSFVAAASGFPTPTVQWQHSTDGGTSYSNIADATSPTYTFTAASADNGNRYRAVFTNAGGTATSTAATLTVTKPPTIDSANATAFAVGTAGSFTVTTTAGYPAATTITKTGTLPAGVSFTDNHNGTATIAGTPTAAGAFPLTITASNGASTDATQSFTLTVTKPPTIDSANATTFTVGTMGSFTVTTTAGYPTATVLSATGALPSGVTFTDKGGGAFALTGSPAAGTTGTYPLTLTASNAAGFTQQAFTLTVAKATQTIAFGALANRTYGDADVAISATASSNLPVAFSVGTADSCTVSTVAGVTTVHLTGAGGCTVTASQAGDGNYNAANAVARAFAIAKATPTVTWAAPAPLVSGTPLGAAQLNARATGVGGVSLSGAFAYTPAAGTVLPVGVGQALRVTFTPADTANYTTATGGTTITVQYAGAGMCNGAAGHAVLQPINADGSSVFKQGSTVSVKFRVCDASGASVGTPGVVADFKLVQTTPGTPGPVVNKPVDSTTPDSAFRWDATAQQWIFNLNTKGLAAGTTYSYRITLNDGSTITFQFGLK